jgi:hypothetical protein
LITFSLHDPFQRERVLLGGPAEEGRRSRDIGWNLGVWFQIPSRTPTARRMMHDTSISRRKEGRKERKKEERPLPSDERKPTSVTRNKTPRKRSRSYNASVGYEKSDFPTSRFVISVEKNTWNLRSTNSGSC